MCQVDSGICKRKSVPPGTRSRTIHCAFRGLGLAPTSGKRASVNTLALLASLQSGYLFALLADFVPQFSGINYSARSQLQSGQQVRWDAYPVHLQFSREFQNLPAYPRSRSLSDEYGQFPQNHSKHLGIRLFYCEDCVSSSQPHYCQIAPPHPAFSTDSV